MQVQIFVEPIARHEALAGAMNAWLAEHPRARIEEREVRIFHNHATNGDDVLVLLFYDEGKTKREGKKSEEK
jgi:hypothetical protein